MTRRTKLAGVAAALFAAPLFAEESKTPSKADPAEVRLVYPASATSTEPIVYEPRSVVPPRTESRDAPFGADVETPIGQVRAVLATLDELRRSQTALEAKLNALADAPSGFDPAKLEAISQVVAARLDALETTLAERDETSAETLAADFATLGARLDALSETIATRPLPPEPTVPRGWSLVVWLTAATCLVVLGRVAFGIASALWKSAKRLREEEFAARLAELEARRAEESAAVPRKTKTSQTL